MFGFLIDFDHFVHLPNDLMGIWSKCVLGNFRHNEAPTIFPKFKAKSNYFEGNFTTILHVHFSWKFQNDSFYVKIGSLF